jgi:hypothetical protein
MRDLEFDIKGRDKTAAAFDSARANARGFNRDMDITARGLNLAATAAKAFAAGLALTALSNFGAVVRQTISDAAELVDMADRVGVSTENIQRMIYGFGQAGVAAGDVDQILTQWSKRIGEAYTNGGRLADIFKANNISLTDSEGRLRSSVDLMRDYANLIANAGSDQERMTLATLGFGKAGDAMVLALRDGADGMDKLMKSADEAGGVIDDELLQRAADIDDQFNQMWRTFETGAKRAILNAVGWLDDLRQGFAEYDKARNAALLGAEVGRMAGMPRPDKGGRLESPIDRRINDAFGGGQVQENTELTRRLRDRFGTRTVIPNANDNDAPARAASASAARDQETAYQRVIERLREEREMLGLNSTEQRVLSEQRRAGVAATSDQGKAIEQVVRQIEAEREAMERRRKEYQEFQRSVDVVFGGVEDTLTSIVDGSEKASTALAKLAINFALAAAQAALFGSGPLAGLGIFGSGIFGGGGGGFVPNTTLSAFLGYRANGGPVDPWGTYVVGEEGPELLKMGGRGGSIVSNDNAFGDASASRSPNVTNVTFNVQAQDAQSFMKSRSQIETMMTRAVARGNRGL